MSCSLSGWGQQMDGQGTDFQQQQQRQSGLSAPLVLSHQTLYPYLSTGTLHPWKHHLMPSQIEGNPLHPLGSSPRTLRPSQLCVCPSPLCMVGLPLWD